MLPRPATTRAIPRGRMRRRATTVMDDLTVRPMATGMSGAALLSALSVTVDVDDVVSWEAVSACPCNSWSCATAATAKRDVELHFFEACFYRHPTGLQ